jgi:two-component system phosphate regulon sensor histidine kinase PhoR
LRHYLVKVDKNVERLCLLVSDLDEITNLETGEINLNYSNFNLKELIEEIIDDFDLKSKQFEINVFIDKNETNNQLVYADVDKIRQVFVNLIDNSLKYGNPKGETRISLYDMAENVLIEVTDNGIGIKENHLFRLFERFYRTDESRNRKIGGTGLGLAIVKHIIEAHHQTINVRSTYGLGTTFAFTLRKRLKG